MWHSPQREVLNLTPRDLQYERYWGVAVLAPEHPERARYSEGLDQ